MGAAAGQDKLADKIYASGRYWADGGVRCVARGNRS